MRVRAEFIGGPKDGEVVFFSKDLLPSRWVQGFDQYAFDSGLNTYHAYDVIETINGMQYIYCGVIGNG